ncbi:MAG: phosphate signaling complex protein PhoU [Candidatus Ratteibacteria bacterium]|jgi:phosphate transport system protein
MERRFEEELHLLNRKLLWLALTAEEAIRLAIESLENRDAAAARKVIEQDEKIDGMELEIEEYTLLLLAKYQPQASDLRFVTYAMKFTAELERIADLAVNISEQSLKIMEQPLLKPLVDIPKMSQISQEMVRDVINAFVSRDVSLAKKVILADQEVDRLHNQIQDELVYDYISKEPSDAPRAIALLLVARHLERIGDHATNIAEDVIYMVNAEVVKHHPERL